MIEYGIAERKNGFYILIEKIKELVEKYPKHYSVMIHRDAILLDFLKKTSTLSTDHIPSMVRNVLYGDTDFCPWGNKKVLKRLSEGFIGCGPSSKCKCTRESISSSCKKSANSRDHAESNQKRKITMLSKYGVEYNSQRESVKEIISKPKISEQQYKFLSDSEWLDTEYNTKKKTLVDIAQNIGVYYGTVRDYCDSHGFDIRQSSNYSIVESQIKDYIRSLGLAVTENDRILLHPKEIDILVEEKSLAIEVNGLYWHSYHPQSGKKENKNIHLEKSQKAEQQGFQLLHITDHQWINKNCIIKSMLKVKLDKSSNRIFARKCNVVEISTLEQRTFLDKYHLDGYSGASGAFGLIYNGRLVSVLSYSHKRFGDKNGIEIVRFATIYDTVVVGGLSRLLARVKKKYPQQKICTFCSNDISLCKSYQRAGFTLKHHSGPSYFWTNGNVILSRYQTQKKKLKTLLGNNFDPNKSESENMFNNNFRRYWTSGNWYLET